MKSLCIIERYIKKSKRPLMVISTIVTLFMMAMITMPVMNSSALDLGLISKDFNVGSIDTNSLFNCVGAAITCDNDNTVNNNVATTNTNPTPDEPGTLTVSKVVECKEPTKWWSLCFCRNFN